MAIVISSVGQSGAKNIFEILAKGLLAKRNDARCVYEPYLWNISVSEKNVSVQEQCFRVGRLDLFNMAVHCNTPLFLAGRHMLHDAWLRKIFGSTLSSSLVAPANVLVKVIRGSGRLEAYLTRFDNLKVVLVTRNVVDTVNSGLGLLSFFGDEFHLSDKVRFAQEVNQRFDARIDLSLIENEMQWSVLWWHYFTEASIRTYEKFPDRVLLVPYENYLINKLEVVGEILEFTGIDRSYIDWKTLENEFTPKTSVSYLDTCNIEQMNDEIMWYFERLKGKMFVDINPHRFRDELIAKYAKRKYVKSPLLTEKTDLTVVQWRMKLGDALSLDEKSPTARQNSTGNDLSTYTVARAIADFGSNETVLANARAPRKNNLKSDSTSRTLGVLITCFNNKNTIAEAIYSVLSQSRKPELIVVADDCSTDGSVAVIREIAVRHKEVHLVKRAENVGVSANRDLAIRQMDTDYITTLDGDDLFMPGKLELEYFALGGALNKVAFSNIAIVEQNESRVQDTHAYSGKSNREMLSMLASRSAPVPRDMMFPRCLFDKAAGFDVGMDMYEDWAFKMRLMSVSIDAGWVHSGGVGTVYDRRSPGLSGKPSIFHAQGQLRAIARNSSLLLDYPEAIYLGLKTVSKHLKGEQKIRFDQFIDLSADKKDASWLKERLHDFWSQSSSDNNLEKKEQDISRFLN